MHVYRNLDLWDPRFDGCWRGITTNGVVKINGELVMGAGVAKQARDRYPGIAARLGRLVREYGNVVHLLPPERLFTFPTKHRWREASDPQLIVNSANRLVQAIEEHRVWDVILPAPGCSNGGLAWGDVELLLVPILGDRVTIVMME